MKTIEKNVIRLSERERHRLLVEWNNTNCDFPRNQCIHSLFEAKVAQYPDAVAVVFEDRQLTYQELNTRANQLAHYLLEQAGVGPEVLVGICVARSLEMVIGYLGILKAGGAYLPLDPTYPHERLAFMLEDAQVPVLLTQSSLVKKLPKTIAQVVYLDLDIDREKLSQLSTDNLASDITPSNLAYVIYTSGSTGKPKGVAISHSAVNRLVFNTNYINIEPSDRIAQASNVSFDAATFEIWGALLHGARLVGITKDIILSPQEFSTYLREQKISVIFLTTALFNQLACDAPYAFQSVQHVLFGGEAVEPKWVRQVLKNYPPQRLLHVYGPTENTTFTTWYLVEEVPEGATNLPIGRPIANTQVYILDQNQKTVPIGVPGELHIGGAGLARGYLNRPDLTAEKFIPNPFNNEPSSRLYKTGDLARYLSNGNIEFLGRLDNQVKIRGYRIELGEIESVLGQHPAVHKTVVMAREDVPGEKYLVAYLVANQEYSLSVSEMRRFLKDKLPDYMVPSTFALLDTLPLTPNGKIDRKALPNPLKTLQLSLGVGYVKPANDWESIVVNVWKDVLGLERVGVTDNFFDLGGTSLLIRTLQKKLEESFNRKIPIIALFDYPTVRDFVGYLDNDEFHNMSPLLKRVQRRVRSRLRKN